MDLTVEVGAPSLKFQPSLPISMRKAELRVRNGPSRNISRPEVDSGPRNPHTGSGVSPQVRISGWSMRLRPTSPLELAVSEASSSVAFWMAFAASTYTLPRAVCGGQVGSVSSSS